MFFAGTSDPSFGSTGTGNYCGSARVSDL